VQCNNEYKLFLPIINVNIAIYTPLLFQLNHADLSPNYSGFLCGITNTFASMPGFVAPVLTGILTNNNVRLLNQ
jgi:hypothetical protein